LFGKGGCDCEDRDHPQRRKRSDGRCEGHENTESEEVQRERVTHEERILNSGPNPLSDCC
jgi:hypothetical protein